jgi:hypothetical protein
MYKEAGIRESSGIALYNISRMDGPDSIASLFELLIELSQSDFGVWPDFGVLYTFQICFEGLDASFNEIIEAVFPTVLQKVQAIMSQDGQSPLKLQAIDCLNALFPRIVERLDAESKPVFFHWILEQFTGDLVPHLTALYRFLGTLCRQLYSLLPMFIPAVFQPAIAHQQSPNAELRCLALSFWLDLVTFENGLSFANTGTEPLRISRDIATNFGESFLVLAANYNEDEMHPRTEPRLAKQCLRALAIHSHFVIAPFISTFCDAHGGAEDWHARFAAIYCLRAIVTGNTYAAWQDYIESRAENLLGALGDVVPVVASATAGVFCKTYRLTPRALMRVDFPQKIVSSTIQLIQRSPELAIIGLKLIRAFIPPFAAEDVFEFHDVLTEFLLDGLSSPMAFSEAILRAICETLCALGAKANSAYAAQLLGVVTARLTLVMSPNYPAEVAAQFPGQDAMFYVREVFGGLLCVARETVRAVDAADFIDLLNICSFALDHGVAELDSINCMTAVILRYPCEVPESVIAHLFAFIQRPEQDLADRAARMAGDLFVRFPEAMFPRAEAFMTVLFTRFDDENLQPRYASSMFSAVGDIISALDPDSAAVYRDHVTASFKLLSRMELPPTDPELASQLIRSLFNVARRLIAVFVQVEGDGVRYLRSSRNLFFLPVKLLRRNQDTMCLFIDMCPVYESLLSFLDDVITTARTRFQVELHWTETTELLTRISRLLRPAEAGLRLRGQVLLARIAAM